MTRLQRLCCRSKGWEWRWRRDVRVSTFREATGGALDARDMGMLAVGVAGTDNVVAIAVFALVIAGIAR